MTVSIIGLGLIGGSLAKMIKERTYHRVLGFDRSEDALVSAFNKNAIDDLCTGFEGTDFTFIALYPDDTVEFLTQYAKSFKAGSAIIDLCGVKRYVCDAVNGLFPEDVIFVGGHPMAGRECSGFENSLANLFDGASIILTPDDEILLSDIERVCDFLTEIGFSRIEIESPERHDEIIAYTSQLAHIVSSAYVKNPLAKEYLGFSAGSFKDMTRVAKLNEDMWTSLFMHNSDYLCEQIGVLINNLNDFRDAIAKKDSRALHDLLREGREFKEKLDAQQYV